MAAAMFPNTAEKESMTTVQSVMEFSGVANDVFAAVSETLGRVTTIRVLAMIPPPALRSALEAARVPVQEGVGTAGGEGRQVGHHQIHGS